MIKRLRQFSHKIDERSAQFGRGADKWLDARLAVFLPYAAAAAVGAAHFFRLVVRGAEMHGERTGEAAGIKLGRSQGVKLGRLIQYLESCEVNGWSLSDDVFEAIFEAKKGEYWPAELDERWPGLYDDVLDCSYFVMRHRQRPDMTPTAADEQPDVGSAVRTAAARARGGLQLDDDPYAQYRGTVLRPVPDDVDGGQADGAAPV